MFYFLRGARELTLEAAWEGYRRGSSELCAIGTPSSKVSPQCSDVYCAVLAIFRLLAPLALKITKVLHHSQPGVSDRQRSSIQIRCAGVPVADAQLQWGAPTVSNHSQRAGGIMN